MRKVTFLVLLFICLASSAQIKGFVGIKGGGQLSSMYIEATLDQFLINAVPIPGYHMGVSGKIFTNKRANGLNAGLQLSGFYMQKGWKQTFPVLQSGYKEPDYTSRLNFLEIPAEAVIYGGKGNTKFFFSLGTYLEYLLSVEQDHLPNTDSIGSADFYTYVEGRDKRLGYGARVSGGLWYEFGFGTIQLEGFATYSISSIIDHGTFSTGLPDLSNSYVGGFSIAYLIPFGKMEF